MEQVEGEMHDEGLSISPPDLSVSSVFPHKASITSDAIITGLLGTRGFLSSVRSSRVFIMGYYISIYKLSFPNFSNLEQSCLYTFINHFHFHSVFNIQNRTRQYFCMNYIDNACMYKFLQDSTRFFRFL